MRKDAGENYANFYGHATARDLRAFSASVFAYHLKWHILASAIEYQVYIWGV